jgi:hypothetical protein
MPQGKAIKGTRHVRLYARDGTGQTVDIVDWSGEVTISEVRPGLVQTETLRGRGRILGYLETDETEPTFEITTWLRNFSGSIRDASCGVVAANLIDVLQRRGACAGWTSTLDPCKGSDYCVDLIFEIDGPTLGDPSTHTVELLACKQTGGDVALAVTGGTLVAQVTARGGIDGDISMLL